MNGVMQTAAEERTLPVHAPEMRMGGSVLTSIDSVRAAIRELRSFLDSRPERTLNSDPERFLATLSALPETRPYLVLFRDSILRAVIIGRSGTSAPSRRLGYLKLPMPRINRLDIVYGGLLSDGSSAAIRCITEHLANLICSGRFDQIRINHLHTEGSITLALDSHPVVRRARIPQFPEPHWVFRPEPRDFHRTMQRFPKKRRNELSRERRRLTDHFCGKLEIRVLKSASDVDAIVSDGTKIASQTYHRRLGVGFSDQPTWRAALNLEAARGNLRAFFMYGGEHPIAFAIATVLGKSLVLEAIGYLPQYAQWSPGKHLLLEIIKHCCEAELDQIDYGFGDAEYKRVFGTHRWEEASLELYSRGWRGHSSRLVNTAVACAADLATRAAGGGGIMKSLKRRWRLSLQKASSGETNGQSGV